jgi:hypothetical protein
MGGQEHACRLIGRVYLLDVAKSPWNEPPNGNDTTGIVKRLKNQRRE